MLDGVVAVVIVRNAGDGEVEAVPFGSLTLASRFGLAVAARGHRARVLELVRNSRYRDVISLIASGDEDSLQIARLIVQDPKFYRPNQFGVKTPSKIEMIKEMRLRTSFGLKESKDLIEKALTLF